MRIEIGYASILKVVGWLLLIEAAMLLIPLTLEICTGGDDWRGFVAAILTGVAAGGLPAMRFRYTRVRIYRREGFLLVGSVWVFFSAIGMLPFLLSSHPLSISDAFFETMSGFTTTGATTIPDVESLGKGLLLWRAMTQWIGGLGIILFMLAVLPSLNEKGGIPMYNAEVTGITHDKLHPQIRRTARSLWLLYLGLTVVLILLLWAGPMDLFESVCQAITAISTGGFSTRNASIAYWNSGYVSALLTLFMFIGGVNFNLIYMALHGRWRTAAGNDVLRTYFFIVVGVYLLFLAMLLCEGRVSGVADGLLEPLFHIVSTITTTGFSLADFPAWGPFGLVLTFILMLCGACAGSTSGAIKIDRILALFKNLRNEVRLSLYPRRILTVRINGNIVPSTDLSRIAAFVTIYMLLIIFGSLITTAFGIDIVDSFFAVVSCIGNNGLGYGLTGSEGGYHNLPDAVKWVLSLMMLIGRLELFSVLVIFFPSFWRK